MSTIAISPTTAAAAASHHASGRAHASLSNEADGPQALVFAVGNAGERYSAVRVVIKDVAGTTVASFALAALSGTQNVIWTPKPGTAAGGYAAYWEGSRLAIETA